MDKFMDINLIIVCFTERKACRLATKLYLNYSRDTTFHGHSELTFFD